MSSLSELCKPMIFVAILYRFYPNIEIGSVVENSTDDNVVLSGKFMRFLKDKECNNGTNHSTDDAGDCRAKVPIHIPSKYGWKNPICWILACMCCIFVVFLEDKFHRSICVAILLIIITMRPKLTVLTDSVWAFYRRRFIKVIYTVLC